MIKKEREVKKKGERLECLDTFVVRESVRVPNSLKIALSSFLPVMVTYNHFG